MYFCFLPFCILRLRITGKLIILKSFYAGTRNHEKMETEFILCVRKSI